jgi:death-on-curing protein
VRTYLTPLEAALFRPQSGYYGDEIAEVAALFESLAMNHPFVDGNKRIAFACVDVVLRVNGHRPGVPRRSPSR